MQQAGPGHKGSCRIGTVYNRLFRDPGSYWVRPRVSRFRPLARVAYPERVQELLWVAGLLLLLVGAALVNLVPWLVLLRIGEVTMLGAAAIGIPLELVYFGLLAYALSGTDRPDGWYWRSFEHHKLLTRGQRRWVLPWFYAGALSFLVIVIGMLILFLAVVAAVQQA